MCFIQHLVVGIVLELPQDDCRRSAVNGPEVFFLKKLYANDAS